jgi:hypothetical protein
MMVSLPIVFSYFKDDPGFYNPASFLLTASLFLVLLFFALRGRMRERESWLAVAAVAALALLPLYHRQQDTKLLLLAVPGCAMLWARGGPLARWLALLVSMAGLILTGDLLWVLLDVILKVPLSTNVRIMPVPLMLLATGIFWVWVHADHSLKSRRTEATPDA